MSTILVAAESVFPGHPDKLADAIADALVQEAKRRDPRALCRVEVAVRPAGVLVTGRVAGADAAGLDVPALVRGVYASAGYGGAWQPAPETVPVQHDLRLGPLEQAEAESRQVSGALAVAAGYAIDLPGTNYLPPEQWLAHRLRYRLQRASREPPALRLGPYGRIAVVLEETESAWRLAVFSAVLQSAGGSEVELSRAVRELVRDELHDIARALPGLETTVPDQFLLRGVRDGAGGESGLSGRNAVFDAYGPRVPLGGGVLSGRDFYQPERAAALLARRLARAVVATGAARSCTTLLAFFPGSERAHVLGIRDEAGRSLEAERWWSLLDFSLTGAGKRFTSATDLVEVARQGPFTDGNLPWERLHFD
jgi:S-adenosylmethionine synthetase